ncbi:hemagglutinin repeat-containing protein [Vibrio sp. PP-XX7]
MDTSCDHVRVTYVSHGQQYSFKAYQEHQTLRDASALSRIVSASDLTILAHQIENEASEITGKNVSINAAQLTNHGLKFENVDTYFDYQYAGSAGNSRYLYKLNNTRVVNTGVSSVIKSSITATNNLSLNVSNQVNNSVIGKQAAISGSSSTRTLKSIAGPVISTQTAQKTQSVTAQGQVLKQQQGGTASVESVRQTKELAPGDLNVTKAAAPSSAGQSVKSTQDLASGDLSVTKASAVSASVGTVKSTQDLTPSDLNVSNTPAPSASGQSVKSAKALTSSDLNVTDTPAPSGSGQSVKLTQDLTPSDLNVSNTPAPSASGQSVKLTKDLTPADLQARKTQHPADGGQSVAAIATSAASDVSADDQQRQTTGTSASAAQLTQTQPVTAPTLDLSHANSVAFPAFNLPSSPHGLFHYATEPQSHYVIETNPALTSIGQFVGSDYFKDQVDYHPETDVKFLGDAYYDTRVVTQAIFEQTGKHYLNQNVGSDLTQMEQLMQAAAAEKSALDLKVGVSLSDDQVASLTHDIVWYEQVEVNGQSVLAPKLYLASVSQDNIANGALIGGNNVGITAGALANSGDINARNALQVVSSGEIRNTAGNIKSDGDLLLTATQDLVNQSGTIAGNNVALSSLKGSVLNQTVSQKNDDVNGWTDTDIGATSTIDAQGTLAVSAAQDIVNHGARMTAQGDAALKAGQNVTFSAIENETQTTRSRRSSLSVAHTVTHQGSTLDATGNLSVTAGQDLQATAATLSAGKTVQLAAGHDVILDTAVDKTEARNQWSNHLDIHNTTTNQGTSVSGTDVVMSAGNDMTLTSAQVNASGNAVLHGVGDVVIQAANDSDYTYSKDRRKKSFGRVEDHHS